MPSMDYLLEQINVNGPEEREEALNFNKFSKTEFYWPTGWWAVSDEEFGYLAFFQFEEDAWAYRLYLVNLRMNAKAGRKRYRVADKHIDDDEKSYRPHSSCR